MPDTAFACRACADRAVDQLHTITDTVPAARDVAHGFARHGTSAGGNSEPRLPLNLDATQRLSKVQDRLTEWCRQIASERGIVPPWVTTYGDGITAASGWLSGQTEWVRHHGPTTNPAWTRLWARFRHSTDIDPDIPPLIAAQFLHAVEECRNVVQGTARGPGSQRYLGPCGADLDAPTSTLCPVDCECHTVPYVDCSEPGGCGSAGCRRQVTTTSGHCDGDVYAWDGSQHGTCKTCGATVGTRERQAWLDGEVRARAFRASDIADAYGVNVNTIRSQAARGQILEHGRDREDRPLYLLGPVLDLFRALAVRRAENEAKRARKAATRETEDAA